MCNAYPQKKETSMNKLQSAMSGIIAVISTSSFALDFPASGNAGVFGTAGDYVAADDYTYGVVTAEVSGVNLDLSQSGGKKVTLTGSGYTFVIKSGGRTVTSKGGTWDFSGTGKIVAGVAGSQNDLSFSSAILTNLQNLVVGDSRYSNKLTFSDGSDISTKGLSVAVSTCGTNELNIVSGSILRSTSTVNLDNSGTPREATGHNRLLVSGTGSKLLASGYTVNVGNGHGNSVMTIVNGADIEAASLVVGERYAKNGVNYDGSGNVFASTNANVYFSSKAYAGRYGFGNVIDIQDSTLKCNDLTVGVDASSHGNILRIGGADSAVVNYTTTISEEAFYFGAGYGNEVQFVNGFAKEVTGNTYISKAASNNTLRIASSAKVTQSGGSVYLGYKNANSRGNTVAIDEDGEFASYRIFVAGENNRLVVSNGVFYASRGSASGSGTSDAIAIGYTDDASAASSGCELVVCGSKPSVQCSGQLHIMNGGKLMFGLDGAEITTTPITTNELKMEEGTELSVDCEQYLKYLGNARARVVLARASTEAKMIIPDSILAAANALLPNRCSLLVADADLVLKVKGNNGLVIIFR